MNYDSTRQHLTAHLPEALASQIETLAMVVVGIGVSVSAQIGKIARAMPLDTTAAAKEQRLRRLLDNQRLTQADHYQPLAKAALHGLKGQRVQLLLERVWLRDTHNILVVSIGFRGRSLPLVWLALAHRGQSGLTDQQTVVKQDRSTGYCAPRWKSARMCSSQPPRQVRGSTDWRSACVSGSSR